MSQIKIVAQCLVTEGYGGPVAHCLICDWKCEDAISSPELAERIAKHYRSHFNKVLQPEEET